MAEQQNQAREAACNPILVGPLLEFSSSLFQSIKKPDENVIFSPLSIHLCLNILSLGVKEGSPTGRGLKDALGYGSHLLSGGELTPAKIHQTNAELKRAIRELVEQQPSVGPKKWLLDVLNYVLIKDLVVNPEYIDDTKKYYESAVRQMLNKSDQQEVLDEVGKWCKEAGFKENILTSNDMDNSNVILLNAVRVESKWFEEFREIKLAELFYNYGRPDGLVKDRKGLALNETNVVFFELTRSENSPNARINERIRDLNQKDYDELAELEFRVIRIRLHGNIAYTIIEPLNPDATSGGGLERLESGLVAVESRMSKLLRLLDESRTVLANLKMPAFEFEQDVNLVEHLKSIGLERIFDENQCGVDTRRIASQGVYVTDAKHKALIEVNDKGIKAAGVTVVSMMATACFRQALPQPIELKVQHPFMFLLSFHQLPLFVGHLVHI